MNQNRGYVLIAAASVIWGTMGIFGKLAFAFGVDPITLTALRISISSGATLVVLTLFGRGFLSIKLQDLPRIAIFGILAVALQRVAYFYAVDLTTATIAAVLFYTYPVFVSTYSVFFMKEKVTLSTALAMAIAFIGVALLVKLYHVESLNASVLGLFFGILSSVLFTLYFVLAKKLRNSYSNWTLLLYGDGIGAISLAPALFCSFPELAAYPQQFWLLILVIALLPSLTAYLLFSYALKYVGTSKGSVLSIIEPLSAAFFSFALLGERLELMQAIGIVLAFVGITLLFYGPRSMEASV